MMGPGCMQILEELTERLRRVPTGGELGFVLRWGVFALYPAFLQDAHPALIHEIRIGASPAPVASLPLDDAVFVTASEVLAEVGRRFLTTHSRKLTLEELGTRLTHGVRAMPAGGLADVVDPSAVHVTILGQPPVIRPPRNGDLLGIPGDGPEQVHVACVMGWTRFGLALGFLRHGTRGPPAPLPFGSHRFTTDDAVATGRWTILGPNAAVRDLFPDDAEQFHPAGTPLEGAEYSVPMAVPRTRMASCATSRRARGRMHASGAAWMNRFWSRTRSRPT